MAIDIENLIDNEANYKTKLLIITAIKEKDIITQIRIPVDIYVQEAGNLYVECQDDKEILVKYKLDWGIVEDVPVRIGCLRQAMSNWMAHKFAKEEMGQLWKETYKEVFIVRKKLLQDMRFAFRKNLSIRDRVNDIASSQSQAAMIQDLNDLAVLGKANPADLEAAAFDLTRLNVAAQLSVKSSRILSLALKEGDTSEQKKIKDQAFTHLKEAIDEICDYGQYVFADNEARKRIYSSSYLRRVRSKKTEEKKQNKEESATT